MKSKLKSHRGGELRHIEVETENQFEIDVKCPVESRYVDFPITTIITMTFSCGYQYQFEGLNANLLKLRQGDWSLLDTLDLSGCFEKDADMPSFEMADTTFQLATMHHNICLLENYGEKHEPCDKSEIGSTIQGCKCTETRCKSCTCGKCE